MLRSDFSIAETVVERPEISPLTSNISVLLGKNEGITPEIAMHWYEHTDKKCDIHYIDGGHFFLLDQAEKVINIVNTCLVEQNLEVLNMSIG